MPSRQVAASPWVGGGAATQVSPEMGACPYSCGLKHAWLVGLHRGAVCVQSASVMQPPHWAMDWLQGRGAIAGASVVVPFAPFAAPRVALFEASPLAPPVLTGAHVPPA